MQKDNGNVGRNDGTKEDRVCGKENIAGTQVDAKEREKDIERGKRKETVIECLGSQFFIGSCDLPYQ